MSPVALGGLIAVLGFVSASRIFYRILQPPFGGGPAEIGVAAYLALIAAALIIVSGIVHADTHREVVGAGASGRT